MKLFDKIRGLASGNTRAFGIKPVLSEKEFVDCIRCERSRADRFNQEFSLIVFSIANRKGSYRGILAALSRRLRLYDSIGWYGNTKLGVLLPEASKDAAKALCGELTTILEKDGIDYEIR